ncbi:HXXEE domain-containing protein [Streptomyces sp. NPDC014746]|uniref:HXXEE domain-containing protein n=1 Tax=Streptomyces sp. NPDC014746 TaxID=3364904 RepID=UPI0036F7CEC9
MVFPQTKWLGIAPALFGMMQAIGHGIVFPRIAGAKYSPGFLASFFLHIPSACGTCSPSARSAAPTGSRAPPTRWRSP